MVSQILKILQYFQKIIKKNVRHSSDKKPFMFYFLQAENSILPNYLILVNCNLSALSPLLTHRK